MKKVLDFRYNHDNDTVEVHYDGCAELDAYIQNQVKPQNRVWAKPLRCWVILPEVLEVVTCISISYFDHIKYESLPPVLQTLVKRVLLDEKVKGVALPHEEDDYAKLFLISKAPPFLVKAAYKALAHHYHPDNKETGDTQVFQDISAAYKAIRS